MSKALKIFGALTLSFALSPVLSSFNECKAQEPYKLSERKFDFGYVGIDYKIFHNFTLTNTRRKPIKIDSMNINCDCTTVKYDKNILGPGESVDFRLTFDTKDFYGPVNRKFQVFIGLPEKKTIQFFYLAHVGQWMHGLKPEPFSVFLLPTQNEQSIKITNRFFDELKVEVERQHDDSFTLELKRDKAAKEEQLEIVLRPSPDIEKGTFFSNFTLKVTGTGEEEPSYLTIPVKIVRF